MIVAIDGPAGAGKSSLARSVARELGFQLVETGALYRAVGLAARRAGIALDDGARLGPLAASLDVSFASDGARNRVTMNGEDVTDLLREAEQADGASRVSSLPEVRAALLELQRSLGRARDSVLEGRDIGTVVFPDAELKLFVTASARERARRRVAELAQLGIAADVDAVEADIAERDRRDSERDVAPLRVADDATVIDTTGVPLDEVIARVVGLVRAAAGS